MSTTRKRYTSEFKMKIVLEVISITSTIAEIASKHSIHPTMISTWKADFLNHTKDIFSDPRKKDDSLKVKEEALDEAHRQIGQLTIERDWLKKI